MDGMKICKRVLLAVALLCVVTNSLASTSSVHNISVTSRLFVVFENKTIVAAPLTRAVTASAMYCVMSCNANPVCNSVNAIAMEGGRTTCETFRVTTRGPFHLKETKGAAYYEVERVVRDCADARLDRMRGNGVTTVTLPSSADVLVYCDMETDDGGWTVLQRRKDGSVDFYRDWAQYKHGFGDLDGEFWLGLDTMRELMKSRLYTLRVDLWHGVKHKFAEYSNAAIGSEQNNYTLDFQSYIGGDALDALSYHKGMAFSTFDRDNDAWAGVSCSQGHKGGWWYKRCARVDLNGPYTWMPSSVTDYGALMYWYYVSTNAPLTASEMKIKIKQ